MAITNGATQLQLGDRISGTFAVQECAKRARTTDGQPFISGIIRNRNLTLGFIAGQSTRDSRGNALGVDTLLLLLTPGQVVNVEGTVSQPYSGRDQVSLSRVQIIPMKDVDPLEFLPESAVPYTELCATYQALVEQIGSPWQGVVQQVIDPVFEDYSRRPAAKLYHHAWVSGLIEHSADVAQISRLLAARFTTIDESLLIAAALLHDVGKIDELSVSTVVSYSDQGNALGHIYSGMHRVHRACEDLGIDDFDTTRLLHCIASHHGLPEHGAIVRPLTAEAIILHQADKLSADMAMLDAAVRTSPESRGWSDRVPGLDRPIWLAAARAAVDLYIPF